MRHSITCSILAGTSGEEPRRELERKRVILEIEPVDAYHQKSAGASNARDSLEYTDLARLRGHDPEKLGLSLDEYRQEMQVQDPIFAGVDAKAPSVTVLDPTQLFATSSGRCRVAQGGEALYWDADHVNIAGAMMLRPLFGPIFAGAGKSPALVQDKPSN